jgi:tetratricopeptide (TPR) repeat protein
MSEDRLRPHWIDGDLDATETNLEAALVAEATDAGRAEVLSQLARLQWARGLQNAHALLDEASELAGDDPVARARILLERGRVLRRSDGDVAAQPVLEAAFHAALAVDQHFMAGDAAHACALAGDMLVWTERGLGVADRYPAAAYWRGTLLINLGDWHWGRGEYEQSLQAFEAALAAREQETRNPALTEEARQGVARAREVLARTGEGR